MSRYETISGCESPGMRKLV